MRLSETTHHVGRRIACAGCASQVFTFASDLEAPGMHYCPTCANRLRGAVLCAVCQRIIARDGDGGWVHAEVSRWGNNHVPVPEGRRVYLERSRWA